MHGQQYIQFQNDIDTIYICIHSFSSLSYDRSKASSKASSPHSAIQSFLFQMRVSSPFILGDIYIYMQLHGIKIHTM
jgi:hypothetical protein